MKSASTGAPAHSSASVSVLAAPKDSSDLLTNFLNKFCRLDAWHVSDASHHALLHALIGDARHKDQVACLRGRKFTVQRSSGDVEPEWQLVFGAEVESDGDVGTCIDEGECSSHITDGTESHDLGHGNESSDLDDCNYDDGVEFECDGNDSDDCSSSCDGCSEVHDDSGLFVECYLCSASAGLKIRFCLVEELKVCNPVMFKSAETSDIALAHFAYSAALQIKFDDGDIKAGEMCARASFNALKCLCGEDHADTIACLDVLAYFLNLQGKSEEAGQHYEKCFLWRQKKLGSSHRDTRNTRFILKNLRKTLKADFFRTSWVDEDGVVCPKQVDYSKQCPRGHNLLPAQPMEPVRSSWYCRVCHGEQASSWHICECALGCCREYAVCAACVDALSNLSAPAPCISYDDHSMVGIRLDYFYSLRSNSKIWPSLRRLTTEHVCQMFIKPRTARSRGSWAQELQAHTDTCNCFGTATWFISHFWSNPFTDTLDAVLFFFEQRRDTQTPFVWLDFMATPQIAAASTPSETWMETFQTNIACIGSLLLVVDKWDNPTPLSRAWCVLELHAIAKKSEGHFAIAMTEREKLRFLDGICRDTEAYYNMLSRMNIEKSDCSNPKDRDRIHAGIKLMKNGYGEIERMISAVMEECLMYMMKEELAKVNVGDHEVAMGWCSCLAVNLRQQGKPVEALDYGQRALQHAKAVLCEDNALLGNHMGNLANIYEDLGRHNEALKMRTEVLELFQRVLALGDKRKAHAMRSIAGCYTRLGRHQDAKKMLQDAILCLEQCPLALGMLPPFPCSYHIEVCSFKSDLGGILSDMGLHDEAMKLHQSVLNFREDKLGPSHPDIAHAMELVASVYHDVGDYQRAFEMETKALEFRRRVLPPGHIQIPQSLLNSSLSYERIGNLPRAIELACEAIRLWVQARVPRSHPNLMEARKSVKKFKFQSALQEQFQKMSLLIDVEPSYYPSIVSACRYLCRRLRLPSFEPRFYGSTMFLKDHFRQSSAQIYRKQKQLRAIRIFRRKLWAYFRLVPKVGLSAQTAVARWWQATRKAAQRSRCRWVQEDVPMSHLELMEARQSKELLQKFKMQKKKIQSALQKQFQKMSLLIDVEPSYYPSIASACRYLCRRLRLPSFELRFFGSTMFLKDHHEFTGYSMGQTRL